MKIVCDNCATKYSIADEKVSGKVFKIRCKKCSHVIVVKGTGEAEAAPAAAPSADAGQEAQAPAAVWHLVIDREQVGPMTAEDVRARFASGQIDAETYIWREGYGDWVKLSQSDDFRDLGAAPAAAAAPASSEQATTRVSADLFRGSSEEGPAPSENLFGGVAAVAPGVMTTNAQASTIVSEGGAAAFMSGRSSRAPAAQSGISQSAYEERATGGSSASAPSSASSSSVGGVDVRPMTGQRSENSVLFSLNNLQALAAGSAAGGGPAAAPASGGSAAPRPGYANSSTEGSGLIDIRAMAAQTLAANNFSPGGPSSSRPDELPMAANDAPLFAPVAPAMLLPTAQPQGVPTWVWALVGVGGLGVVALVVVVVMLMRPTNQPTPPNPPTGPVVAANGNNPGGTKVDSKPETKPEAKVDSKPETKPEAKVDSKPDTKPEARDDGDRKGRKDRGDRTAKPGRDAKPDRTETPAPTPAPRVETPAPEPPKKPKKPASSDDLDKLLDTAAGGSGGKPKVESAKKDAPEQLSMDQIKSGLRGVGSAASSCGAGTYMVKLTIAPSGRVSDASVPGKSGDAAADCVARAVKSARFPEFTGSPQTLQYPVIVR